MEIDVKQSTKKTKRRKRAQRMQAERGKEVAGGGELDSGEEDYESLKRDKTVRPPVRRKRSKDISPILEEDIIDGFSILAFKSYEDLEFAIKVASKRNEKRLSSISELTKLMADDNTSEKINDSQSINTEPKLLGKEAETGQKNKLTSYINQNTYSHDAGTSDDSGRASERLTTSSVAQRDAESSRDRLSDASSRCSSGKGYICDSEGDDDKVSDAGSVGFSNPPPFPSLVTKTQKQDPTPSPTENSRSENGNQTKEIVRNDSTLAGPVKMQSEFPPPAMPLSGSTSIQILNVCTTQVHALTIERVEKIENKIQNETSEFNKPGNKDTCNVTNIKKEEAIVDSRTLPEKNEKCTLKTDIKNITTETGSEIMSENESINTRAPIKILASNDNIHAAPEVSSSPYIFRPQYAPVISQRYSPYSYPPPCSSDIKDNVLCLSSKLSKSTVPTSITPTTTKERLDLTNMQNPMKERDNFSDIDSLSISSVIPNTSAENTTNHNNTPPKTASSLTFPKAVSAASWPLSTTHSISPVTTITGTLSKPSISLSSSLNATPPSNTTFTAPLPPPTTTTPLSFSAESLFSTKPKEQTDLLRRELDSRFLDRAGLSNTNNNTPYLRQELHHHQHQHTHLHQHHQQIIPAVTPASSTIFSTPLFKDIPKIGGVDSPFYRTGLGMPMYPAYPPTLLHPGIGTAAPFLPQNHLTTFIPKKTGRWNAMHVRIAWEIYSHQTKQNPEKSNPLKATEILRAPSHLHTSPSGNLLRTHDIVPGPYAAPQIMPGRNLFDATMPPSFLGSSSHLGMSPFNRYGAPFPPAAYASMTQFSRETQLGPPYTGLHDPWRSLQRPFLSTAAPLNWSLKPDVTNIDMSKREAEERERQLRDREEKERLRREREEKERQREREKEREEKLKKEQQERERKEREKRELERREIERERMLQQQRLNEMKPNVQTSMICHDRSPLRNGSDADIRIKEETRKDEELLVRGDPNRYPSSSNGILGAPNHAYIPSRHQSHVLGGTPPHLSRNILPPPPGASLSHFPPTVWSSLDPYRDPYRLDPMATLRYNPLMEAMRMEEERAKAVYAAQSAMHYRPKEPTAFPLLQRMPSASINTPVKTNGPPYIAPVNTDPHKKDDTQNR